MTIGWTITILSLLAQFHSVYTCSDILVTPGASEDGSAIIAYNADDVRLFGYLYHYPSTQGNQGEKIQIYEWDSGVSASIVLWKENACEMYLRTHQ